MNGEVSFEALRRVQITEKTSPALTSLEPDFYSAYAKHLTDLEARLQLSFTLEGARVYESERKVLQDVWRRREQKILLKALHDFEAGGVSSEGLASEEKELYTSAVTLISQYRPGSVKEPTSVTVDSDQSDSKGISTDSAKAVIVKLLVDLPQFVGATGPIGPFAKGAQAQLSAEDAGLLVSQGAAQYETKGALK